MLYCVSYSNGPVGIFSSMDKVKELVFNRWPSIVFVTQVFKSADTNVKSELAWIILYKNSEAYAFVSDDENEVKKAIQIFDKIGKVYEELIEYLEQKIDEIAECVENILDSLQNVYGDTIIDSSCNIISYV